MKFILVLNELFRFNAIDLETSEHKNVGNEQQYAVQDGYLVTESPELSNKLDDLFPKHDPNEKLGPYRGE